MEHTQAHTAHNDLPTDRRALLAGIGGLAAGAFLAGKAHAGPLTPPPGPIAPTPGPEPRIPINQANTPGDTDSLYIISQPGSYYLTGNITGVAGKRGIAIAASGVTLDLNGFDLVGVPGSSEGVVALSSDLDCIEVRNGTVRAWGGDGVFISAARSCMASRLRLLGNAGFGLRSNGVIDSCVARENGQAGIAGSAGCMIRDCISEFNGTFGITSAASCVLNACVAFANGDAGISANSYNTITACTAASNGTDGIIAGFACHIADCACGRNNANGISVNQSSNIQANVCYFNTQAGIHAYGSHNRIEANHCSTNEIGIEVTAPTNILNRNTCAQNSTNWNLAAGNIYGPIIDQTAPATAAVNGNAAPSTLGSANANTNFSL